MKPPETIDGAIVIEWAWSGHIPFGVIKSAESNEAPIEIYGLALCQYIDANVTYRFSCNAKWETEQDFDYSSVEDAKANIPQQYRNVPIHWIKYVQNT
ncbi:hypothetical protein [Undibacterium sp.]|uniref:hypothetical protein n=1 Tax=Undibacterium sp. TaxID=1914977 RepID=UPI0037518F17